jgi:hypothetical protein
MLLTCVGLLFTVAPEANFTRMSISLPRTNQLFVRTLFSTIGIENILYYANFGARMKTRSLRLRASLGIAISLALSGSVALAPISASAATFTLTCTQTGATATPFSLTINNSANEVIQATAQDCGGALTIPEGVQKIGFGAFVPWDTNNRPMANGNITSISIPSTLTDIWVGGFIGLPSVSTIHVPSSVTSIGHQAFQGMTSLTAATIEGSSSATPTTINYFAFNQTVNLDLTFGSGKVVLLDQFGAGAGFRSVNLGSGMLSIGKYAFAEQQFADLTIPPSVTTISEQAFASMPNLHEIKFGATTPGITSIDATAFTGTNVTSVQYCGGNTALDSYLSTNLPNADVYCDATVAPNTPAVASATAGDNSVTVVVTPGAENAGPAPRNYSIEYSSDSTNWSTYVRTPASSSTSVTVPNLSNETAYTFRVAAINPGGTSAYSAASSSATPRAPRYGITYAAGAGTGTLPTDSNVFLPGESATLLPAPLLAKPNFTFAGWSNGTTVYQPGNPYLLGSSNVTLTAQWVQNSLFGITPTDLNLIGTLTAGDIDTSISGTSAGSTVSVSYLAGALTTGTVIRVHQLANSTTRATSLLSSTPSFIVSFVVSWLHELTGDVPNTAAGKPITMTITNALIKKGASAFALVGDTSTLLGTATVDGSVTILITEDPEIVITVSRPSAPTGVSATSGANGSSTITWIAPTNNGGDDITSYVVSSSGGQTCSAVTLSCSISGLTNGTSYTFTVTASNASGASSASVASAPITPAAPVQAGAPAVTTLPVPNQPAPVVKVPTANATKAVKAVASQFSPGSSTITKVVRVQVLSMLKKLSPTLKTVACTGFTTGPTVLRSDAKLALNRAKAVCKLIGKLHPKLKIISATGRQETRLGGAVRRVEVAFQK